jgi:hypothetical protein
MLKYENFKNTIKLEFKKLKFTLSLSFPGSSLMSNQIKMEIEIFLAKFQYRH